MCPYVFENKNHLPEKLSENYDSAIFSLRAVSRCAFRSLLQYTSWATHLERLGALHYRAGFLPLGDRPKTWPENNRKISITKEICINNRFCPTPKKFLKESQSSKKSSQLQSENVFLNTALS